MNTNAPPPPRPPLPAPIATFQGRPALYSAFGVTFQLDLLTRLGRLPSRSIPLVDSTPAVVVASMTTGADGAMTVRETPTSRPPVCVTF